MSSHILDNRREGALLRQMYTVFLKKKMLALFFYQ